MEAQEIIEKIAHIPSNVLDDDTRMHVKYLKGIPEGALILDFGTGWGKIVSSIALACPQATIFTFDPGTPYQNYVETVTKYLEPLINVEFEVNNSRTYSWVEDLDVLSIDSSHTYEDTKFEIERFFPFVKPNGVIFMHDYNVPQVGVKQAVDEYLLTHPEYQIVETAGFTTVIKKS